MSKTAIVICSDPKAGTEEALGRLFNALFLAYELMEKRRDAVVLFQGAGTRWPAELEQPGHVAHTLYRAVSDMIGGVCGGCADVFGAADSARKAGLKLDYERAIPGTPGILDLSRYLDEGYDLVVF